MLSRENTSEVFHRNENGQAIQEINVHDNIHQLPELHVPNIPLDEYENCRTIPKHEISSSKVGFLNVTNSLSKNGQRYRKSALNFGHKLHFYI